MASHAMFLHSRQMVSNSPAVQAVALLGRAHRQLGPGLVDLVRSDVKPAQLAPLEEAFTANPLQQVRPRRAMSKVFGHGPMWPPEHNRQPVVHQEAPKHAMLRLRDGQVT